MERNRKGDLAEIIAVAWLWEQGYEVFRNTGSTGVADLAVYIEGKTKLVDVKTVQIKDREWGKDYQFKNLAKLTERQKEAGIRYLYVDVENRIVGWNRDYFPDPD